MTQAEHAADTGMEQALRNELGAPWRAAAERWLDQQYPGALFVADDLVAAIGKPDPGASPNLIGAWINAQKSRRRIEATGRRSISRRIEGHGNEQKLWRVKDERTGGDAECLGPDGVSSSPSGSPDANRRVEASTTSEAREGWREPRHPEADAAMASLPPLSAGADTTADDVGVETRHGKHDGEGDPGSALNALQEPGWLMESLKAENPELWEAA